MAWNPSPMVGAARDFGNKFAKDTVIILFISGDAYGMASYGKTKKLCDRAGRIGNRLFKSLEKLLLED